MIYFKSEVNASFLRAARAGNIEKVLEFLNDSIEINVSNSVSFSTSKFNLNKQ